MNTDRLQNVLDVDKGLGVIAMVLVHSLSWIIPSEEVRSHIQEFPYSYLSYSLIITLFALFLPGLAAAQLYLKKNTPSQIFDLAVLCLSAGFAFSFLLFEPEYWSHWDVLHFLGVSFFLLIPLYFIENEYVDWLFLFLFAFSSRYFLELFGPEHSLFKNILVGEEYTFWPLFPWFAMLLNGRIAVRYFNNPAKPLKGIIVISLVLIFLACLLPSSREYLASVWYRNSSVYHPPLGVFLMLLSGFWLMLSLTALLLEKLPRVVKVLSLLGRQIFWVFVIHVFAGYPLAKKLLAHPVIPRTLIFVSSMFVLSFVSAYTLEFISNKRLLIRFVKQ